jgi:hypothetical protein
MVPVGRTILNDVTPETADERARRLRSELDAFKQRTMATAVELSTRDEEFRRSLKSKLDERGKGKRGRIAIASDRDFAMYAVWDNWQHKYRPRMSGRLEPKVVKSEAPGKGFALLGDLFDMTPSQARSAVERAEQAIGNGGKK